MVDISFYLRVYPYVETCPESEGIATCPQKFLLSSKKLNELKPALNQKGLRLRSLCPSNKAMISEVETCPESEGIATKTMFDFIIPSYSC